MSSQEIKITKNQKGRPATGQGEAVVLRLHDDILIPLDNWIGKQPGKKLTRQQAIYQFIRERLGVEEKR